MYFNFPSLLPGYLGMKKNKLTLNASFYAELFNSDFNFDTNIIFPQRVPKKEFFEEIAHLEDSTAVHAFKQYQNMLLNRMTLTLTSPSSSRALLNMINILLRYGLNEAIYKIAPEQVQHYMSESDFSEFLLIKLIASSNLINQEVHSHQLVTLANTTLTNSNDPRVQILVLNYLVVAVLRFGVKLPLGNNLEFYSDKLLDLIKDDAPNDFASQMRTSIAYRGLAMLTNINELTRQSYMEKAEGFARTLNPRNVFEKFTAKENLYTCLQSLSKWHLHNDRLEAAKLNLVEMTALDPCDSTAYGELGILELNEENYAQASECFQLACQLGPPAVAMHKYYQAKSLQLLGQRDLSIEKYIECISLDNEALSPCLDLVDLYIESNQTTCAKKIISRILNTTAYMDQLDARELADLKSYL